MQVRSIEAQIQSENKPKEINALEEKIEDLTNASSVSAKDSKNSDAITLRKNAEELRSIQARMRRRIERGVAEVNKTNLTKIQSLIKKINKLSGNKPKEINALEAKIEDLKNVSLASANSDATIFRKNAEDRIQVLLDELFTDLKTMELVDKLREDLLGYAESEAEAEEILQNSQFSLSVYYNGSCINLPKAKDVLSKEELQQREQKELTASEARQNLKLTYIPSELKLEQNIFKALADKENRRRNKENKKRVIKEFKRQLTAKENPSPEPVQDEKLSPMTTNLDEFIQYKINERNQGRMECGFPAMDKSEVQDFIDELSFQFRLCSKDLTAQNKLSEARAIEGKDLSELPKNTLEYKIAQHPSLSPAPLPMPASSPALTLSPSPLSPLTSFFASIAISENPDSSPISSPSQAASPSPKAGTLELTEVVSPTAMLPDQVSRSFEKTEESEQKDALMDAPQDQKSEKVKPISGELFDLQAEMLAAVASLSLLITDAKAAKESKTPVKSNGSSSKKKSSSILSPDALLKKLFNGSFLDYSKLTETIFPDGDSHLAAIARSRWIEENAIIGATTILFKKIDMMNADDFYNYITNPITTNPSSPLHGHCIISLAVMSPTQFLDILLKKIEKSTISDSNQGFNAYPVMEKLAAYRVPFGKDKNESLYTLAIKHGDVRHYKLLTEAYLRKYANIIIDSSGKRESKQHNIDEKIATDCMGRTPLAIAEKGYLYAIVTYGYKSSQARATFEMVFERSPSGQTPEQVQIKYEEEFKKKGIEIKKPSATKRKRDKSESIDTESDSSKEIENKPAKASSSKFKKPAKKKGNQKKLRGHSVNSLSSNTQEDEVDGFTIAAGNSFLELSPFQQPAKEKDEQKKSQDHSVASPPPAVQMDEVDGFSITAASLASALQPSQQMSTPPSLAEHSFFGAKAKALLLKSRTAMNGSSVVKPIVPPR